MSITHYEIMIADSATELERLVRNAIEAGFQPLGGVSVCFSDPGYSYPFEYAQAIVMTD